MGKILVKVGFFVEGQTERIFLVKYLAEYLAGEHNFSRTEIQHLGSRGTKILTTRNYPESNYYVLIFDCSGDGNVIPALRDRAQNMINQEKYQYLIAIQDLYDRPRSRKREVITSFNELFSHTTYFDNLKFVLAIMEIESWFIADYNLFQRINPIATPEYIRNQLNIDLINTNPETHRHPSEVINRIYQLFGQTYKKREEQSYSIVSRIDYDFLYSDEVKNRVESWNYFANLFDTIFERD